MTPTPSNDVRLATARLLLRPPVASDIEDVVAGVGDFEVTRMLTRVPHPYARADAETWIALSRQEMASGSDLPFSILDIDGRVIGGVGLHGLKERPRIGYWLARDAWGKGFATEASVAVLKHAFGALGLAQMASGILEGNTASMRVQEKLGFTVTGRSMAHCLARGLDVPHIDTELDAVRFKALWA